MKHHKKLFLVTIILIHLMINVVAQPKFSVGTPNNITLTTFDLNNGVTNFYIETHKNGTVNTGSNFNLYISNLPVTTPIQVDVKIKEKPEFGGVYVYTARATTDATGRVQVNGIDPIALNLSGPYEIEVYNTTGSLIAKISNYYIFFEKVKVIIISGAVDTFKVHYTDAFFKQTSTGSAVIQTAFLTELENAIRNSWKKEVVDLNLGVPKTKNIYDIYLHCNLDLGGSQPFYHNSTNYTIRTDPYDHDKNTYIDTKVFQALNTTNITEQDLLYQTFSHELFHSIQWSYMSFDSIASKFNTAKLAEIEKRKWLIEGQALLVQTVFTGYYKTPGGQNSCFVPNTTDGSYELYTKDFINHALDQNYSYKSLQTMGYEYALFWRHLYEHNKPTATDKDKLAILPATCKAYNTANASDNATIKTFMDAQLLAAKGNFKNFGQALTDFAAKTYFHSNVWLDDKGVKLNNWNDPNNNDFYKAITTGGSGRTFAEDTSLIPTKYWYGYRTIFLSQPFSLPQPFSFRTHLGGITDSRNMLTVTFSKNNAANGADFDVSCIVFNKTTKRIEKKFKIPLTNGLGIQACYVDGNDSWLETIVTRLDADNTKDNKYTLTYEGQFTRTVFGFNATASKTLEYTIDFINKTSPFLYFDGSLVWDFGDSTTSKENNPVKTYMGGGSYTVTLKSSRPAPSVCTKKNYINILPSYIETLTIKKPGSGTDSVAYKRVYNANTFKFSVAGNKVMDKGNNVEVKVTTVLPLKNLLLELLNQEGKVVYSVNKQQQAGVDTKNWDYLIPPDKLEEGINLLQFTGKDYSDNNLINIKEPSVPPLFIDSTGTSWNVDIPSVTGADKNYVIPVSTANPKNLFGSLIISECNRYEAIFSNNSSSGYFIDFGDGLVSSFPASSFLTHTFSTTGTDYTVKIFDYEWVGDPLHGSIEEVTKELIAISFSK